MPSIKKLPFCSIIVLNYFGEKVIKDTVGSLLSLTYPAKLFEIIIVDNNSKDESRAILQNLKEKNEQIKLIFSDKNLGFSKGNNLGIRQARGEYIALLNNDCVVEKDWLTNLVKTAQKDSQIFAVNSKIKFYPSYLKLKIQILEDESSLLKILLSESNLLFLNDDQPINLDFDLRGGDVYFEMPFDVIKDSELKFCLTFNRKTKHKLYLGDLPLPVKKVTQDKGHNYIYSLDLNNKIIREQKYDKIQNAGIIVFFEGSGRDIGSVVCNSKQVYEEDIGQYENEREIYAATGGAVLFSKKILDKIGYLDGNYFLYYEDVDICERARFNGYKSFYCPQAVARHLHSFSSKEWSPLFVYHAERGRLMHAFFNFPLPVHLLILAFIHYTFFALLRIAMALAGKSKIRNQLPYFKVALYFTTHFLFLLAKKYFRYGKKQRLAIVQNYQDILSGKWYFN